MRILALLLLVAAAAWRIAAVHVPQLDNFSPLMALAFCSGMYFRNRWLWLVPFAALILSDLYLDHYYLVHFGYQWTWGAAALRLLCFAAGLLLGYQLAGRRTWARLLGGALGASVLFFLVTNTASWLGDAAYAHTAAGWWQAMTLGHPQFPSTLAFFRNSLVSDLLFTAGFGLVMEAIALRAGKPSLLAKRA
jgi:hypothetical protein